MANYYHGSSIDGITVLNARSSLHNSDKNVVYLTDNAPYALFYIWDAEKTGSRSKHVTAWVKDGVAYYEEQFPDQLRAFYQGVSGYLYTIQGDFSAVDGRANLFYSENDTPISDMTAIRDVYAALLQYEADGKLVVLRYAEQTAERQNELIELIAAAIRKNGLYANDPEMQRFLRHYFKAAWQKAEQA